MSSESHTEDLQLISPAFARQSDVVRAYFSLKNAEHINVRGKVPGLNIGFNTGEARQRIEKNRKALFNYLKLEPDRIAQAEQVHSNRVRNVNEGGRYPGTDGLVTSIPRLTLAIQVADCAAVLLADTKEGVVAAIHAGWRGAVSGILENALQVMREKGAEPDQIQGYISPCISEKHFEVGSEVAVQFPDSVVDRVTHEKPHVNLKEFLKLQLLNEGLRDSAIEVDTRCTFEESNKFYSYRREGKQSGRMYALIQLI